MHDAGAELIGIYWPVHGHHHAIDTWFACSRLSEFRFSHCPSLSLLVVPYPNPEVILGQGKLLTRADSLVASTKTITSPCSW